MLISVSLNEIATRMGKNQKTIRLWCKSGFVRGAWCSPGGHWRLRISMRKRDCIKVAKRAKALRCSYEDIFAEAVIEKIHHAICLPAGFERRKTKSKAYKEKMALEVLSDFEKAFTKDFGQPVKWMDADILEKISAGSEMLESQGGGSNGMLKSMPSKRQLGGGFVFADMSPPDDENVPLFETIATSAKENPFFTAAYGAARNMLNESGRCSSSGVAKRLGISRSMFYRLGCEKMVKMAKAAEKRGGGGEAWSMQVEALSVGGSRRG